VPLAPSLAVPDRMPDRRPTGRHRARARGHDRRRRGDAAGEPGLRGERARLATRSGAAPCVWALPLADLGPRLRLIYAVGLVYLVVAVSLYRVVRRAGATSCPTPSGRPLPACAASCCWPRRRSSTTCSSPRTTFYENRYLKDVRGYSATLIASTPSSRRRPAPSA
jgi:hypothetical protein